MSKQDLIRLARSGCSEPNRRRENNADIFKFRFRLQKQGRKALSPRLWSSLPTGIVATPGASLSVVTLPLNPETVSGYSGAETCAARFRAMLRLGHARTDKLTGQRETENDCPLGAGGLGDTGCQPEISGVGLLPKATGAKAAAYSHKASRSQHSRQHSGDNGFLFLSFFTDASQRIGSWAEPTFPWGVPFFSALCFCFAVVFLSLFPALFSLFTHITQPVLKFWAQRF